jgi:hypothetical protein
MTFTATDSIRGAIDRMATQAGALLIAGVALFGTLRAAAGQDIYAGIAERILREITRRDLRAELGPEGTEILDTVQSELIESATDLPLALGLDLGGAIFVWLVAYVLGLAVLVAALMAFGNRWERFDQFALDNVGWKVLNFFLGTILFSILVFIGLVLLVVPGLILIILFTFFPAAIAIDDESAFGSFSKSIGVVRENFLSTIGLIFVGFLVFVISGFVGFTLGGSGSSAAGAVFGEVVSAVATVFGAALIAEAYVQGTR